MSHLPSLYADLIQLAGNENGPFYSAVGIKREFGIWFEPFVELGDGCKMRGALDGFEERSQNNSSLTFRRTL